jgi:hypothetical protein
MLWGARMLATPFSPRLIGRPVIWDADETGLEGPAGGPTPSPKVLERAKRLGRGLKSLGVRPGQHVVVLCCVHHLEDRSAAIAALEGLGAVPVVPRDWDESTLGMLFAKRSLPSVHLACEEGVAAWRAVRGTGIMIGDGDGVMWWKGLECRHSAEVPLSA